MRNTAWTTALVAGRWAEIKALRDAAIQRGEFQGASPVRSLKGAEFERVKAELLEREAKAEAERQRLREFTHPAPKPAPSPRVVVQLVKPTPKPKPKKRTRKTQKAAPVRRARAPISCLHCGSLRIPQERGAVPKYCSTLCLRKQRWQGILATRPPAEPSFADRLLEWARGRAWTIREARAEFPEMSVSALRKAAYRHVRAGRMEHAARGCFRA